MPTHQVFVHGYPDSPTIWGPLLARLSLAAEDFTLLTLPGFVDPLPRGFSATKDAYAQWLIDTLSTIVAEKGPVDLIGHDWGGLLTLRVACLRADLLHSWVAIDAALDPAFRGHLNAGIWNMPVLGELSMALVPGWALAIRLRRDGVPADIAAEHGRVWARGYIRSTGLKLYRSANGLRFSDDWFKGLQHLSKNGLLIWGEKDPYMTLDVAQRFAARHDLPLAVIEGAGHWALAQKSDEVAARLLSFLAPTMSASDPA